MAAAGLKNVDTTARALAKQASIDRSLAAVQGLNDAAALLRSQGDLLASCLDDSGDEATPMPEMQKVAVHRFLSRRLSRQASRGSSKCLASTGAKASMPGNDIAATTGGSAVEVGGAGVVDQVDSPAANGGQQEAVAGAEATAPSAPEESCDAQQEGSPTGPDQERL
ncbi:hypothetical protein PLESTM_001897700 [Pleodorina starrii]|nr:hypothetical protein PLESTM_001897700 [Pleodorina starrii]